jgi:hypothetical protein
MRRARCVRSEDYLVGSFLTPTHHRTCRPQPPVLGRLTPPVELVERAHVTRMHPLIAAFGLDTYVSHLSDGRTPFPLRPGSAILILCRDSYPWPLRVSLHPVPGAS